MSVKKIMWTHLSLAAFLWLFHLIYFQFSHGVDSVAMKWMFLIPLVDGCILFLYYRTRPGVLKTASFRLWFNVLNSGAAICVCGLILKGIMDIAGTSHEGVQYYFIVGAGLMAIGWLALGILMVRFNQQRKGARL